MRSWSIGISEGDALRDEALNSTFCGCLDKITGTLVPNAGIQLRGFFHSRRIKARRKVGKLMNDDVRFSRVNRSR